MKLNVLFRKSKLDNGIIALFPNLIQRNPNFCKAYIPEIKETEANISHVIEQSSEATEEDFSELLTELEEYYPDEEIRIIYLLKTPPIEDSQTLVKNLRVFKILYEALHTIAEKHKEYRDINDVIEANVSQESYITFVELDYEGL